MEAGSTNEGEIVGLARYNIFREADLEEDLQLFRTARGILAFEVRWLDLYIAHKLGESPGDAAAVAHTLENGHDGKFNCHMRNYQSALQVVWQTAPRTSSIRELVRSIPVLPLTGFALDGLVATLKKLKEILA